MRPPKPSAGWSAYPTLIFDSMYRPHFSAQTSNQHSM